MTNTEAIGVLLGEELARELAEAKRLSRKAWSYIVTESTRDALAAACTAALSDVDTELLRELQALHDDASSIYDPERTENDKQQVAIALLYLRGVYT